MNYRINYTPDEIDACRGIYYWLVDSASVKDRQKLKRTVHPDSGCFGEFKSQNRKNIKMTWTNFLAFCAKTQLPTNVAAFTTWNFRLSLEECEITCDDGNFPEPTVVDFSQLHQCSKKRFPSGPIKFTVYALAPTAALKTQLVKIYDKGVRQLTAECSVAFITKAKRPTDRNWGRTLKTSSGSTVETWYQYCHFLAITGLPNTNVAYILWRSVMTNSEFKGRTCHE